MELSTVFNRFSMSVMVFQKISLNFQGFSWLSKFSKCFPDFPGFPSVLWTLHVKNHTEKRVGLKILESFFCFLICYSYMTLVIFLSFYKNSCREASSQQLYHKLSYLAGCFQGLSLYLVFKTFCKAALKQSPQTM